VADNSRAEESIYSSRGFYGKEEVTVYRQQIAEVLKRVDAGVKLSHCCRCGGSAGLPRGNWCAQTGARSSGLRSLRSWSALLLSQLDGSNRGCEADSLDVEQRVRACHFSMRRLLRPSDDRALLPRKWLATPIEQFIQTLDCQIQWTIEKRIKTSLGSHSPHEIGEDLGNAA